MTINITDLLAQKVQYLNSLLLDSDGRVKLLPASVYREINPVHLRVWGMLKARYTFPTIELVDWLNSKIGARRAIEIGAGMGDLGYRLDIRMTDNYSQQLPEVKAYYAALGQVPTNPPADVERLDAIAAIAKYAPAVVVGSYVTQVYRGGRTGNMFGPEEQEILDRTQCYIHIGNETSHGDKRILRHPHQTLRFDWLVTRSAAPEKNVIYVWGE